MKKIYFLLFIFFSVDVFASEWSYKNDKTGPNNWGNLEEEYKFCKLGYSQSPIDIKHDFDNQDLQFFYKAVEVEKERKKFNLKIVFDGNGYVLRSKRKYFLRGLEFHHPSEHLVNSKLYSLEMQIFHKSDDEQLLALALFLELGKPNPHFDDLIKFILESAKDDEKKDPKLDLSKVIKHDDKLFFYDGSFTTPPCKEGVKWYVAKTPIEISKEQMDKIIKNTIFVKTNARTVQKFHDEKY